MPADLQPLGRAVKRLQHKHHRALETRLAEIGTTLAQWDALRAISQHPDSSAHRLATLTFQTDQAFGTLANRMIERELIERVPGAGRALLHQLTPEGKATLKRGHDIMNRLLAESFEPLSAAERRQLMSLIERLLPEREA